MTDTGIGNRHARINRSPGEVFTTFLKLGLTSFGGPIAHLGYFRDEIVVRRKWLSEQAYADLVALCQFLPGPASSQVGFALGLMRGGPLGAMAAWAAFTLPSAILLIAFAYGAAAFDGPTGSGLVHGLKIVAVAVVAQAVWGMAKSLTPDRTRAAIALLAVCIVVFLATSLGQLIAIGAGAVLGLAFCRSDLIGRPTEQGFPFSKSVGAACLALFVLLLIMLRSWPMPFSGKGWYCLTRFSGQGLSSSVEDMSSCRCWRRRLFKPAWQAMTPFSLATVLLRPCRGRCSRSLRISARPSRSHRTGFSQPRSA